MSSLAFVAAICFRRGPSGRAGWTTRPACRSPKRVRSYTLPGTSEAHKDAMLELNEAWAGSRPFWLYDHTDRWVYGMLTAPMEATETSHQRYLLALEFREVTG